MGTLERRKREKDERRTRIIDAAEKVLVSKGYPATTMDDVAAEAEVGKGTLYLYFKNKDELIMALAMRVRTIMLDGFDEAIQAAISGLDLLRRLGRVHCDVVETHRDLFMLSFHVLASGFKPDTTSPTYTLWKESGEWALRIAVNAIERGKLDGSVRPDVDAMTASMHLFGGALGVTLVEFGSEDMRQASPQAGRTKGLLASFMGFFIDSIAAPGARTAPGARQAGDT